VGHHNLRRPLAARCPKYFTAVGAGWEPLLRYGQSTIQDKVPYGTGAFLLGRRPADLLSEMRALPIRRGIFDKWLWRNAAALMGIDVGPSLGS
jgi:predicted TIM-barrel fold metal-dependent hydrolase